MRIYEIQCVMQMVLVLMTSLMLNMLTVLMVLIMVSTMMMPMIRKAAFTIIVMRTVSPANVSIFMIAIRPMTAIVLFYLTCPTERGFERLTSQKGDTGLDYGISYAMSTTMMIISSLK